MSSAEQVRVVIVGAGLMGRWHGDYAARSSARVTAVVDPRLEAAEALAKRYGAVARRDLDEAPAAQIAHVCASPSAQAGLTEQALEAGLHVLAEKPPASNAGELGRLLALADSRNRLLCPVHQFPFQRGFQALRDRQEALGDAVRIEMRIASAGGEGLDSAGRRSLLWSILPHAMSVSIALRGIGVAKAPWRVIQASERSLEIHVEDAGAALSAAIDLDARPPRNELVYSGTQGTARADFFHGYSTRISGSTSKFRKAIQPLQLAAVTAAAAKLNLAGRLLRREWAYPGLPQLIERFYAAATTGGAAPIAPAETLAIYQLIDRLRAQVEEQPH